MRIRRLLLLTGICLALSSLAASEWPGLRGPNRDGVSADKNLPEKWSPSGENLLWRAPQGAMSGPVALGDHVYVLNSAADGDSIRERLICLDANSGKIAWEKRIPQNRSEIAAHGAGGPAPALDPESGFVYVVTAGGRLAVYTHSGMPVWMRSLAEEFGFQVPGNGRIASPVVDESLVIVSGVTFDWGDLAGGAYRFIAFDKQTGETVWVSSSAKPSTESSDSPPMITEANGRRLLIAGGSDGAWHAIKVATGESVWRYEVSRHVLRSGAVRAGRELILAHGEENLEAGSSGLLVALDPSVNGEVNNAQTKWVRPGFRSITSPVTDGTRVYLIDSEANLAAFNVTTGDEVWRLKLGTGRKADPVLADGKLYVGGEDGRFYIVRPRADGASILSEAALGAAGKPERISGGIAVSNGRIYLATSQAVYAIGTAGSKVPVWRPATALTEDRSPAYVQVVPADTAIGSGQTVKFRVRLLDASGNLLREVSAPPQNPDQQPASPQPPPRGQQPAARLPQDQRPPNEKGELQWSVEQLAGTVKADGSYTAPADGKPYAGKIKVRFGNLTGEARLRVIPSTWDTTFDDVPVGSVPGWWLSAAGKFAVKAIDGNNVLAKIAGDSSPSMRRAHALLGLRTMTNYTVQADVRFVSGGPDAGEAGVLAQGYEFVVSGSERIELRPPQPATASATAGSLRIPAGEWRRLKLKVETQPDGSVRVHGKAWPADQPEPQNWNLERTDKLQLAVPAGSPGLYADTPAEVYFDNLKVMPNK